MKKRQVDHVLRAAGRITGEKQFIIVGSQALHGRYPDLADEIVKSAEVDLFAAKNPARTDWLNSIGIYSAFHESHGYYADPVDDKTSTLPKGWKGRLVNLPPGETDGVKGLCLEPHDLAIAKYAASREKDLIFNRELAQRGLLSKDRLFALLEQTAVDDPTRERIRGQIDQDFGVLRSLTAEPGHATEPVSDKGASELGTTENRIEDLRRRGRESWLKIRQQRLESGSPTLEEIQAKGREDWLKLRERRRQGSQSPDDDGSHVDQVVDSGRDKQTKDSSKGVDDDFES